MKAARRAGVSHSIAWITCSAIELGGVLPLPKGDALEVGVVAESLLVGPVGRSVQGAALRRIPGVVVAKLLDLQQAEKRVQLSCCCCCLIKMVL